MTLFKFVRSACSQAPGFSVVPHAQKTPQPIVPKQKSYSSSRKSQKTTSSVGECSFYPERISKLQSKHRRLFVFPGHHQPGSGQGSPCGLDPVPSPQSLISSTPLVKNEQNQVCLYLYFLTQMLL